jgi:uncharacterized protein with PIN domain
METLNINFERLPSSQGKASVGTPYNRKTRRCTGLKLAYALAKATGEPLLFKGKEFSKTDVRAAE